MRARAMCCCWGSCGLMYRAVSSMIQRGHSPIFANAQRVFDRVCASMLPRSTVRLQSIDSRSHMALPTPTFGGMPPRRISSTTLFRCRIFSAATSLEFRWRPALPEAARLKRCLLHRSRQPVRRG